LPTSVTNLASTFQNINQVTIINLESRNVAYVTNMNRLFYEASKFSSTTISFTMKQAGLATIKVYDMLGCMVVQNKLQAQRGENAILFNGSKLSSGVYYYQLNTKGFSKTL